MTKNSGILSMFKNVCLNKVISLNFKKTNLGLVFILFSFLTPSLEKPTINYQKEIMLPILKNVRVYKTCCISGVIRVKILELIKHVINCVIGSRESICGNLIFIMYY